MRNCKLCLWSRLEHMSVIIATTCSGHSPPPRLCGHQRVGTTMQPQISTSSEAPSYHPKHHSDVNDSQSGPYLVFSF